MPLPIGLPCYKLRITKKRPEKEIRSENQTQNLFQDLSSFLEAPSPAYRDTHLSFRYRSLDLLWRPVGILVRSVLVIHPQRGSKIFMTTDLSLLPLDILRIYGFRFKIEVSFKQALYTLGTYAYHFWMAAITPRPYQSGDQYLHRKPTITEIVCRKMQAYHCHMQLGIIAQGLLQYLSLTCTKAVWSPLAPGFARSAMASIPRSRSLPLL